MKKRVICFAAAALMLCGCGRVDMQVTDNMAGTDRAAAVDLANSIEMSPVQEPERTITLEYEIPEPAAETDVPELDLAELFEGEFRESRSGRAKITVTKIEGSNYSVHISWGCSASDVAVWDMTGEFDGRNMLRYSDCVSGCRRYSEDGSYTEETNFTDGTGYLKISQDGEEVGLFWGDDVYGAGDGFWFVRE